MKYFLLIALTASLAACEKSRESFPVRGKLIRNLCVDPIVQILDSNYYHMGETWTDTMRDVPVTYENVFTVDNPCDYTSDNISEGSEFNFRFLNEGNHECAVCAMFVTSPSTRRNIKVQ